MNPQLRSATGLGLAVAAGAILGWFARSGWMAAGPASPPERTAAAVVAKPALPRRPDFSSSASRGPSLVAETTTSPEVALKKTAAPASSGEVLRRLLDELEKAPKGRNDAIRILGRLQQLRDMGTEGASTIRDFLQSREDIVFDQPGFAAFGGRQIQIPSLRAAMVETLYEMNDPAAVQASLDVLRSTTSGLEMVLAARNLEKAAPGTYREDAVKALGEVLSVVPDTNDPRSRFTGGWQNQQVLELLAHYQARELIPQAEQWVSRQPQFVYAWLNTLNGFPSEDQAASLRRLMQDPKIRTQLVQNPYFVGQLNLDHADSRTTASELYGAISQAPQKAMFIQQLGQAGFARAYPQIMQDSNAPRVMKPSRTRIEGALRMLDELAPKLDTPDLQRQAQQARQQLQAQLKSVQ